MIKSTFLALLTFTLCAGCASTTRFTNLWRDPAFQGPPLTRVLVLGLFKNDTQRRSFEQSFVDEINANGGQAVASYTITPNIKDLNTKPKVKAALDKANADAFLITRFEGISREERYVPPSVDYVPSLMGAGYYGYYGPAYQAIYSPGYTTIDARANLETRVYALSTEKLVWASETESISTSSADKITSELVQLITTDMKQYGLIQ